MKKIFVLMLLTAGLYLTGCGKNMVTSPDTYTVAYQKDGLLDSISGTCSVIQTRWFLIDTLDMRNANKIKIDFDAFTDADISFVQIYHVDSDVGVNILDVTGSNQVSNTKSIIIDSPKIKKGFYMRIGLSSSVCTGQQFNIKLRDLKISYQ